MGMYTKLVLNAPLEHDAGVALDRCITTINSLYKSITNINDLAEQIKDKVPFGMDAKTAIMILLNNEDNTFYSKTQVHFSEYGRKNTSLNNMLLLTVNIYIKNYDNEIEKFLHALAPHVISNYTGFEMQFLGSVQREDADLPSLIFHDADTQKIVGKLRRL